MAAPTHTTGLDRTASIELATGYEHAEQYHVNPTPFSTMVGPPAVAPPNGKKSRPIDLNDVTHQDSR